MSSDARREPQILACRQTSQGVELDLRISADLAPLAGHFPDLPIVPGVCLVDWAALHCDRHLGQLDTAPTVIQVKFRRIIQPGVDVTLALQALAGGRVRFEYRRDDTVYATGTFGVAAT
jgi:3-hydroxymyristoyl/3-hydroxydecanoyl-(acyl carrier protein) dehydratase